MFAGLTVIIALVGLLVINIPFLTVMGLAAAGTVALAVLIAITLLPAILGFAGDRMRRTQPRAERPSAAAPGRRRLDGRPLGAVRDPPAADRRDDSAWRCSA